MFELRCAPTGYLQKQKQKKNNNMLPIRLWIMVLSSRNTKKIIKHAKSFN